MLERNTCMINVLIVYLYITDKYIEKVRKEALRQVSKGHQIRALHLTHRKSIAVGVMYTYRQFCHRKQHQMHTLVQRINHIHYPDRPFVIPPEPDTDPGYAGQQMQKYAQSQMLAQCSFERGT